MVKTIMTVPRALISGLIEFLSMPKIFTGTVCCDAVAQNKVAVTSSKEIVNENNIPAKIAGDSSGKVTDRKV